MGCAVADCVRAVKARGWCNVHYQRWKRRGGPTSGRTPGPSDCAIEECAQPRKHRDWCGRHYQRWLKYGDPLGGGPAKREQRADRCSVDDCPHPVNARDLCNRHYLRWRNHGDPLGGRPGPSVRVAIDHGDDTRTCTLCGERKPLTDYAIDSKGHGGRRSRCKPCHSAKMRDWYTANGDRQRARARERQVRDAEIIRARDRDRYERDKPKRIALAKEAGHRRRARLKEAEFDPAVSIPALRERDGDLCRYCKREMDFVPGNDRTYRPLLATIDHVVPISRGGGHTFANTVLACRQCNTSKNGKNLAEWEATRADH